MSNPSDRIITTLQQLPKDIEYLIYNYDSQLTMKPIVKRLQKSRNEWGRWLLKHRPMFTREHPTINSYVRILLRERTLSRPKYVQLKMTHNYGFFIWYN